MRLSCTVVVVGAILTGLLGALVLGPGPSSVAADDDRGGGSTVPIPPPPPPTPSSGAGGSEGSGDEDANVIPSPIGGVSTAPPAPIHTLAFDRGPDGILRLDLSALRLSDSAFARDADDSTVPLTGKTVFLTTDAAGNQNLSFPVALASGQVLKTLHDPESGLTWNLDSSDVGGLLTAPLILDSVSGGLQIRLGPLRVVGGEAQGPVVEAELEIIVLPVGAATPEQGPITLYLSFGQLPAGLGLNARGLPLESDLVRAIALGAGELNMGVTATAYAVDIRLDLTDRPMTVALAMGVARAWADRWPRDMVHIARIESSGPAEILDTTFADSKQGQLLFRADLPAGFSVFALVALSELVLLESEPGLGGGVWLGVGLGGVFLVGLTLGCVLLWYSRRKGSGR